MQKMCTLSQQSSLETQNSILRSSLYEPYLDNRLNFYPISSNLITTRNKGKPKPPFRLEKLQYDHSSFLFVTRRLVQLVFIARTRLRLARAQNSSRGLEET
jgi:hypothetical protein